jgi:hypothetical protein
MFDLVLIATPAMLVLVVALVLIRSERDEGVAPVDALDDVPTVSVEGEDWNVGRSVELTPRGSSAESTLGRRIRDAESSRDTPARIRVRRRPLVARRID